MKKLILTIGILMTSVISITAEVHHHAYVLSCKTIYESYCFTPSDEFLLKRYDELETENCPNGAGEIETPEIDKDDNPRLNP